MTFLYQYLIHNSCQDIFNLCLLFDPCCPHPISPCHTQHFSSPFLLVRFLIFSNELWGTKFLDHILGLAGYSKCTLFSSRKEKIVMQDKINSTKLLPRSIFVVVQIIFMNNASISYELRNINHGIVYLAFVYIRLNEDNLQLQEITSANLIKSQISPLNIPVQAPLKSSIHFRAFKLQETLANNP